MIARTDTWDGQDTVLGSGKPREKHSWTTWHTKQYLRLLTSVTEDIPWNVEMEEDPRCSAQDHTSAQTPKDPGLKAYVLKLLPETQVICFSLLVVEP